MFANVVLSYQLTIKENALYAGTNLKKINLTNYPNLFVGQFAGTNFDEIIFGENTTVFPNNLFEEYAMNVFNLPASITTVSQETFQKLDIETLILHPNLVNIASNSFQNANIRNIYYDGKVEPNWENNFKTVSNTFINVHYEYKNTSYCGYPVKLITSSGFTQSDIFSQTSQLSIDFTFKSINKPTSTITPSNIFTPSNPIYVYLMRLNRETALPTRSNPYGNMSKLKMATVSAGIQ